MTHDAPTRSNPQIMLALGLASMSTMLLELVLTRIFSASVGYHFAFMIVSMTMFGMTAGALFAFARQPKDDAGLFRALTLHASLFAVSTPIAFAIQGYVNSAIASLGPFAWICITFILYSIVFFFSGTCISLCLTRFKEVGKLYTADLLGAALACLLLIAGLTYANPEWIVCGSGAQAALAAVLFALQLQPSDRGKSMALPVVGLVLSGLIPIVPPDMQRLTASFGHIEYLKWSPIGRVIATKADGPIVTWAKVNSTKRPIIEQKGLFIDFGAFTVMTGGKYSDKELSPIAHDVTALGNRMRPDRSLFVIGVGGGRDILTGLLYGQKHVDGIEVNPAIVSMLKNVFADFNGHIADKPQVKIVNDEARNWLARSSNKYGVIQCSLVDTWSASSSGAFMLTENVLYTKEAFELYIRRLQEDGLLCFLRWGDKNEPAQILRMLYLAKNALQSIGVTDFGNHILLVTAPYRDPGHNIGTMMVSPKAFSQSDITQLLDICKEEGYQPLWVPGNAKVEPFASAINSTQTDPGMPSDDRPFFFTPVKAPAGESTMAEPASGQGLALLYFTLLETIVLVMVAILFPSWRVLRGKIGSAKEAVTAGLYFACLGMAFMLTEVAQTQRLTILLGNPTYGLSVVLFALLLASAIGSMVSQMLMDKGKSIPGLMRIGLIASSVTIAIGAIVFNTIAPALEAAQLAERMVAAVVLVAVPGFFMGWGFPLGMSYFRSRATEAGAWYWSINGATSVLASVLAAIISIIWGIRVSLLAGAACYAVALLALL